MFAGKPGGGTDAQDPAFVPGEILISFKAGLARGTPGEVRRGFRAELIKEFEGLDAEHWRLPPGLDVLKAVEVLSRNPNVEFAEPNHIIHAFQQQAWVPNDPLLSHLWGMHNFTQSGGTTDADIDAVEAWQLAPAQGDVIVAVIDSGIDYTHPDLVGRIWRNPREIPGNGKDDDRNGYIDDVQGWDFCNGDNDPMDDYGHGTHVAGTIAASGNNGVGVIGVAGLSPNVKLLPIKFLNSNGSGTLDSAISAIQYVGSFLNTSKGKLVRLSNSSWGSRSFSGSLKTAISKSGQLFVAAAGNSGDSELQYPAGYNLGNIVAVAASDASDALASYATFGSWVHLAAPGQDILSTMLGQSYAFKSGSSMAAPHVTGTAAVLMAANPAWTVAQIRSRILSTVDSVPALAGKTSTGGRLNTARTFEALPLPGDTSGPGQITSLAASALEPSAIGLSWVGTGDDGALGLAYCYDVRYRTDGPLTDSAWDTAIQVTGEYDWSKPVWLGAWIPSEPDPAPPGTTQSMVIRGLDSEITHYIGIKVFDEFGNASPLSCFDPVTTPGTGWAVELLDSFPDQWGPDVSIDFDISGLPAMAYCKPAPAPEERYTLKFARFDGSQWLKEDLVTYDGYNSLGSLVIGNDGDPALVFSRHFGDGTLHYLAKSGQTWSDTVLEVTNVWYGPSLALDPEGDPFVAYDHRDPYMKEVVSRPGWQMYELAYHDNLKVARRKGGVWTKETVDADTFGIYTTQIAFHPSGNGEFIVAYGDSRFKVARWDGTSWHIDVISDDWGSSEGITCAYNTLTGYPAVAYGYLGRIVFRQWNGTAWSAPEDVGAGNPGILLSSLAFLPDGTPYVAHSVNQSELRMAGRGTDGVWKGEAVDTAFSCSRGVLKIRSDGMSFIGYGREASRGVPAGPAIAVKQLPLAY